jgi:hypothetical protein
MRCTARATGKVAAGSRSWPPINTTPAEQHGEVALELAGVAIVVADEYDEAVGDRSILQAAHDRAEEGVGDVVYDRSDDLAAPGDEGTSG